MEILGVRTVSNGGRAGVVAVSFVGISADFSFKVFEEAWVLGISVCSAMLKKFSQNNGVLKQEATEDSERKGACMKDCWGHQQVACGDDNYQ